MKKLLLLALLLCGFMQIWADTWTDSNGITWSFSVNGTEATDIKPYGNCEKIYLYGDPNSWSEKPFQPAAWDASAMRFNSNEGQHLPTISDEVYFNLKTLIFDVSDVSSDFDMKVMNGWWTNTYYDHVKWVDGLNKLQITETMALECAKGGYGHDLNLMLYSGSMTFNAVYYEAEKVVVPEVVVIPEKVYDGSKELTVTSIGSSAFSGCSGLTSVTIPSSVTSIGVYAFSGCSSLSSVTIPESVTSIGDWAFYNCSGLSSVTIPSSVTNIGSAVFYNCSSLTSVTIPEGVTNIGDRAFYNCSVLTSVIIPEGVTNIGVYAFYNCSGLSSVTIPESVTSIDNWAFSGCSGLTSVSIPSSVTSIGAYAFSGCSGLTSISVSSGNTIYDSRDNCNAIIETATNTLIKGCKNSVIPSSVTGVGEGAFCNCSSLTSVTIPSSVTSIGIYAFSGCSGLASVTIPSSVTSIRDGAFSYCSSLTSVTIPSSVTSVGVKVFDGCSGLMSVTFEGEVSSILSSCGIPTTVLIYVPQGTKKYYQTKLGTSYAIYEVNELYVYNDVYYQLDKNNHTAKVAGVYDKTSDEFWLSEQFRLGGINYTVIAIGDNAFCKCKNITDINIPETVSSIGSSAFSGCSSLTSVTIPESVSSIGSSAFSGCSGLTSVTIPSSVASLGNYAFDGCSDLTSVTIEEGVASLGNYAFRNCSGLTSVTIPSSVTSIGEYAFHNCTNLIKVIVPDIAAWCGIGFACSGANPLSYAHHLYSDENTEITDLTIPEGVTSIGSYAFSGCSGLTGVTIPEGVTSIGNEAFYGCIGLTGVTIPSSVASLGDDAFFGCSGLTGISVSNGNTIYDSRDNCNAIIETATNTLIKGCQNSVIPSSVTSIGSYAFYGCSDLTSVTIPSCVTNIGWGAFFNCPGLTSVTCYMETPPSIRHVVFANHVNATLYVPSGCKAAYESAVCWQDFYEIIEMEASAGDVNGDHEVDVADFTVLANYLLGKSPVGFNPVAADVAGSETGGPDGEIDIADLTGIANIILHGNTSTGE